jgi:hypothetical protein
LNGFCNQSILRARKTSAAHSLPKDYRYTLELVDEATQELLARCMVIGTPMHKPQVIELTGDRAWSVRPNRKIMPSHWILADPDGSDVLLLDQRIFGKLSSPLTRVGMDIKDPSGTVLYRVVEPEASLAERLLGPDPDAWAVDSDRGTEAFLASMPKSGNSPKGWRGKLQRFIQGTDFGLLSLGEKHLFAPAEALTILLIFRELRDISHSVE